MPQRPPPKPRAAGSRTASQSSKVASLLPGARCITRPAGLSRTRRCSSLEEDAPAAAGTSRSAPPSPRPPPPAPVSCRRASLPGGLTARPVRRAGPPPARPRPPPAVCGPEGKLTGVSEPRQRRAKEPRSRSLKATDSHVPALSVSRRRRASCSSPRAPRTHHNARLARFRQADSTTAPVQPRQGRTPRPPRHAARTPRGGQRPAPSVRARAIASRSSSKPSPVLAETAIPSPPPPPAPPAPAAPPHAADEINLVGDRQRRHAGPGEDLCESRLHRLRFARPRL